MAQSKTALARLGDLAPGQAGDFFVLLTERTKMATRENKAYYSCRFRDARRTAAVMVWADSKFFASCDQEWQVGQFFKVRGTYVDHPRYGSQVDVDMIRPVRDADEADGSSFVRLLGAEGCRARARIRSGSGTYISLCARRNARSSASSSST